MKWRIVIVGFILVGIVLVFVYSGRFVFNNDKVMSDNTEKTLNDTGAKTRMVVATPLSNAEILEIYSIFDQERHFWRSLRSVSAIFKSARTNSEIYGGKWRSLSEQTKSSDLEVLVLCISEPPEQVVDSRYPYVFEIGNDSHESKWRLQINWFNGKVHREGEGSIYITSDLAQSILTDFIEPWEMFYDFRNVTEKNFAEVLSPSRYDAETKTFVLTTSIGYKLYFVNGRYCKVEGKREDEGFEMMSSREDWRLVDDQNTFPHKFTLKRTRPSHIHEHEILLENVRIVLAE